MSSRRCGRGRDVLPAVWEGLKDPLRGLVGVRRTSWRSGWGLVDLLRFGQDWGPSQRSRRGREALLVVQEGQDALP